MARKLIYIVGGVVVALLIVVLVLPFVIDANRFRPEIESSLDTALNRKVEIGNIRLSILSGGITVENISISDDPAFNKGPFLKARSLNVNVDLMPLIFSRAIHITGLTIDQPSVTLLRSSSGTWNFSTLGAKQTETKTASASTTVNSTSNPDLSVHSFSLKNGTMIVGRTGGETRTHTYEKVNIKASDLSYTTQFPFELTAQAPGNGAIKLTGKAGPLNSQDAAATPLNANLEIKNLDLKSTGFVDPSAGISGVVDFNGTLNSDGHTATTNGKVTATRLQVVPAGSPSTQPVTLDYQAAYELKPQTGQLRSGNVHIGKATAELTGTFNNSGPVASVEMKLIGQNMPAADLESVLPAVGVTLPSGASLKQGTLNANLAISGPVDKLVITGPVNLSNAKLTGFDLGSKMGALSTLSKVGSVGDTDIQTFSSNFRVAPEGIRSDNLNIVVPAIGSMTGNGTISADHRLDFKMIARLGRQTNSSSQATTAGAAGGIPFKVQGTTSNPQILPDFGGIAGSVANGLKSGTAPIPSNTKDLGNALGGLFGGKKKQ
ncbi:MAG TPA: AsmA family protein [Terriglobales bacterium]|nr:AsmA family protein [Terriglobales bacterium]HZR63780.1 AsmA family protein [Terriglobales bacterium]